ncbi:predicted protein [Botrytis cinerea T4]|uniref:Uncharacterized protein n=1 Tax=Botryotinia fuckeliana (strain T4) TaxID=999810 RepID=G2YRM8_BOTF4|nr:predicted protein [Botrytis cinerea T4]
MKITEAQCISEQPKGIYKSSGSGCFKSFSPTHFNTPCNNLFLCASVPIHVNAQSREIFSAEVPKKANINAATANVRFFPVA